MVSVAQQNSNTIQILERLARMAYKKINSDTKISFDDMWTGFRTTKRLKPDSLFFKKGKVQNYKLNLCEGNAKLMFSLIAYAAAGVEKEEFESLRIESNRIWLSQRLENFEHITLEIFLHKDKLVMTILTEASEK